MKKVLIAAASALMFMSASYVAVPEATAQGTVTPDPCLPGYKITMQFKMYTLVGSTWVYSYTYTLGFNTDAEISTYITNYNTTHTTTMISGTELCRRVVGGPL